ncbi:hypothetical protein ACIOHE_39105 [Streptomyces sp. NPDC087851]|uniref:hypothetical protein n=1 Tax=Streptomyces sp. NPDC087851 TaxID=3365810 RepID=UPI0037FD0935
MPYDVGATARLTAECRDPGGTLTTATTAALTIGLPDGTSVSVAPEETDTPGRYRADYPTTQPGRHTVGWQFTGPGHAYTDVLDVRPSLATAVMSMADARNHLKLSSTARDTDVREWLEVTTDVVEWFVGPVAVRTVTEVHQVRQVRALALRQPPALELLAVDPVHSGGTTYDVGQLTLDGTTGVVQLLAGPGHLSGPLRVTYTAGRRIVPPSISGAARIILGHLWRTQQGPGRPQTGGGDDFDVAEPIFGLGYAIPNRAVQLLSPYQLPPGNA